MLQLSNQFLLDQNEQENVYFSGLPGLLVHFSKYTLLRPYKDI